MKISKIKKAMGLGQIFGIIIVAIIAAFVINKIRVNMQTAESASTQASNEATKLFDKAKENLKDI